MSIISLVMPADQWASLVANILEGSPMLYCGTLYPFGIGRRIKLSSPSPFGGISTCTHEYVMVLREASSKTKLNTSERHVDHATLITPHLFLVDV